MLHHRRQLDHEGLRQRADGCAVFAFEPSENRPPSRVYKRRKRPIEPAIIVHHVGKYWSERADCQPRHLRTDEPSGTLWRSKVSPLWRYPKWPLLAYRETVCSPGQGRLFVEPVGGTSPRQTAGIGALLAVAPGAPFCRSCAGFRTPAMRWPATGSETGVGKAPRHEIAGGMGHGRCRRRYGDLAR